MNTNLRSDSDTSQEASQNTRPDDSPGHKGGQRQRLGLQQPCPLLRRALAWHVDHSPVVSVGNPDHLVVISVLVSGMQSKAGVLPWSLTTNQIKSWSMRDRFV